MVTIIRPSNSIRFYGIDAYDIPATIQLALQLTVFTEVAWIHLAVFLFHVYFAHTLLGCLVWKITSCDELVYHEMVPWNLADRRHVSFYTSYMLTRDEMLKELILFLRPNK